MSDLKNGATSYPQLIDNVTLASDGETVAPATFNGPAQAIIAIEQEIGIGLKGTQADLVTRLAQNIYADGGLLRGAAFPVAPPNLPHIFWRTDLSQLYVYDTGLANYQRVDSTNVHANLAGLAVDDHPQYTHNATARTITAQHTFSPSTAKPPFVLGANAQSQKIVGLEADKLDGVHANATPTASTIVVSDSGGKLSAGWGGSAQTLATLDANSRLVETANKISDGTNTIHVKIVDIGDWNMDITTAVAVNHGLTLAKIRASLVTLIADSGVAYPIPAFGGTPDAAVSMAFMSIADTKVNLGRVTGGIFDNASFSATSFNRGYITIWYVE